jgi:hypothetical protein|tara:strand:+ start:1244 stop:1915 length:672 start_codon:yes stop_codon:yes gene_type:complete
MAVAPLNKFRTIAVPVAPGVSTVYSTPTGVSAIILFASVSNVGIGTTYPNVTFTHQRKSLATRTLGNTRNTRVIKEAEVPPNDSLIIIDGRLVLERTALIEDSVVISGIQSGIVDVDALIYDHNSGLTTITTVQQHSFSVGDEIAMSNLVFSCSGGSYGFTTTIFPDPQRSFTVSAINVDSNTKKFETNVGIVNEIAHTYVSGGQVGPLQMELVMSILENSTS